MKKEQQASNGKKILKFLLEQQLPDARVAGGLLGGRDGKPLAIGSSSTTSTLTVAQDVVAVQAVDHVTQVALETCRCVHLQEHFPHLLDLELCKAVHHPRGWLVSNPVHSMHLQTQLEDSVSAMAHDRQPPVLYGEEQQRTMALSTEGIVEYWCPLDGNSAVIHDDTAMEKMEHMPTLQNIHKPSTTTSTQHSSSLPPPPRPSSQPTAATTSSSSARLLAAAHPSKLPGARTATGTAVHSSSSSHPAVGVPATTLSPIVVVTSMMVETPNTAPVVPDMEAHVSVDHETKDTATLPAEGSAAPTQTEEPSSSSPHPTMEVEGEEDAALDHRLPQKELSAIPEAAAAAGTDHETNELEPTTTTTNTVVADLHPENNGVVVKEEVERFQSEVIMDRVSPSADTTKHTEANSEGSAGGEENLKSQAQKDGTGAPKSNQEDNTKESIGKIISNDGDRGHSENDDKNTLIHDASKKEEDTKQAELNTERMEIDTESPTKDIHQEGVDTEKPVEAAAATSELAGEQPKETEEQGVKMETDTDATEPTVDGKIHPPVTSSNREVSLASVPAVVPSAVDATVTNANPNAGALLTSMGSPPKTMALSPEELIPLAMPEDKFNHLRMEEDRIRLIRRSLSSHRIMPKKKLDPKKKVDPKNKRKREDIYKAPGIPGWHASNPKELTQEQEEQWVEAMASSREKVERWMDNFRICRETFWDERERQSSPPLPTNHPGGFYLPQVEHAVARRCCEICTTRPQGDRYWDGNSTKAKRSPRRFCGDELMQCLECSFVGCSPKSITRDSRQHILEHLLHSGHKFAVSCGERGQIFCFCCGDFVYHEVFEQEKARIDYGKKVPMMAWKSHMLYRSFDPFHFMKTQDHGIVWRGLVATYPQLVPYEHVRATEATSRRQDLFNGMVHEEWLANRPGALTFAASQSLLDKESRQRIRAPVGMYNLGNTCYKSAVLQCLVHCQPLQRFFLKQNGHHHHACVLYRQREASKRKKKKSAPRPEDSICLACEMDKLYLAYYGSTIGIDVRAAVEEACSLESPESELLDESLEKGDPLVISEMLTASWKSGGMNSLASYKQHDSHEFMNSFLEMMAKQTKQHWARVLSSINLVEGDNALFDHDSYEHEHDIVKTLFEGSLSSVLLCEECGTKRKRTEEFLNVSLSLSEEVARMQSTRGQSKSGLSVETCLERFVMPEKLGDGVDCPSCARKTSTQKQHTFGTLPKVLCLHLKRFNAALNKKIDDYVSFPAQGLDMGKYLAQWCEVSSLRSTDEGGIAEPQIYYDLFGTVNHVGNLQSGHYVTNVKVDDRWYNFNDAHVSLAGGDGGEESVVKNKGAYILFYVRREERPITLA